MRSSTKERGKLFVIGVVFLSILIGGGYLLFGPKKSGSIITSQVRIIDKNKKEDIEMMVKYRRSYAFKVEENGIYFLEMYTPENSSANFKKGKYDMDKKDFDSLETAKDYWFDIEYKEADMPESGIVRKVYTEDPVKR